MKYACRYAIVKFLPYPETGEFANIGVVLACPALGYFGFELLDKGFRRVTNFFEELDNRVYRQAVKGFAGELERIRAECLRNWSLKNEPDLLRQVFDQLVHPREAIIRFDAARVVMTEDPAATLGELYGHYVHREFAKEQAYQERLLVHETRKLLRGLKLVQPFRAGPLGNDEFHARFDFIQKQDDQPLRVIKPFYLAQDDANKIYKHADPWVQAVRRLRKRNYLPEQVLFAVEAPEQGDTVRFKAYNEIRQELEMLEVLVAHAQPDAVTRFATGQQLH